MISARSPWRGRLRLLGTLLFAVLVNVGVLVAYRGFSDTRIHALEEEKKSLEARRDAARQSIGKLDETVRRLDALEEGLERFYESTLGSRKERLAPLIEEIHTITKKAGLFPDAISYAEQEAPGGEAIRLNFRVVGTYPDIKRLLATFESSARFLVVESLALGVDESGSDLLNVSFILAHYFREPGLRHRRPVVRAARSGAEATAPEASQERRAVRTPAPGRAPSAPAPEDATAATRGGGILVPRVGTAPGLAAKPRPTNRAAPPGEPRVRVEEASGRPGVR